MGFWVVVCANVYVCTCVCVLTPRVLCLSVVSACAYCVVLVGCCIHVVHLCEWAVDMCAHPHFVNVVVWYMHTVYMLLCARHMGLCVCTWSCTPALCECNSVVYTYRVYM